MAEYLNPTQYFNSWNFPKGTNNANRITYPTTDWEIPQGYQMTNAYYTFEYQADRGIWYNFPAVNPNANTSMPAVTVDWKPYIIQVPPICWAGVRYGNTSSFRIGFRATSGTGTTSAAKHIRNIVLTIEYQAIVSPSSVTVERVDVGEQQVVTLENEWADACHKVQWKFLSGQTVVLQSEEFTLDAATRSVSWGVPSASIPTVCALAASDSTTITGIVSVKTYQDSTYSVLVGGTAFDYDALLTMTAEQGSPTITTAISGTFDPGTPAEVQALGEYVQNFSTLNIVPTVTTKYGATVASQSVSTPNGMYTTTSGQQVSIKLTTSGQRQFSVVATDSRGFSTINTYTINVAECAKPAFTSARFFKTISTSSSVENDEGGYLYATATFTKDANATVSTVSVAVKEFGSSAVFVSANMTPTLVNNIWTVSGYLGDASHLLDKEKTYTITFSATDSRNLSAVYTGTITAALYTIHRQSGGRGVAFGKISELQGVEINPDWPFYTHGQEIEKLMLDFSHPVGSILQTFDASFDPNEKWPWSLWGKLSDVFLYASGGKPVGQAGGSTENGITGNGASSPDAHYRLALQDDGNLVLYDDTQTPRWATSWTDATPPYSPPASGDPKEYYATAIGATSAAASENNMPPYLTVNMWVRAR